MRGSPRVSLWTVTWVSRVSLSSCLQRHTILGAADVTPALHAPRSGLQLPYPKCSELAPFWGWSFSTLEYLYLLNGARSSLWLL